MAAAGAALAAKLSPPGSRPGSPGFEWMSTHRLRTPPGGPRGRRARKAARALRALRSVANGVLNSRQRVAWTFSAAIMLIAAALAAGEGRQLRGSARMQDLAWCWCAGLALQWAGLEPLLLFAAAFTPPARRRLARLGRWLDRRTPSRAQVARWWRGGGDATDDGPGQSSDAIRSGGVAMRNLSISKSGRILVS